MARPAPTAGPSIQDSGGTNVQVEHGYTRIANELLMALALAPWQSGAQRQIVDALVRVTYGFRRHDAAIGTSGWQALTGLSADQVKRAIRTLESNGVLVIVEEFCAVTSRPRRWRLQKDYTKWGRFAVDAAVVEKAEAIAGQVAGDSPRTTPTPGAQTPPGVTDTPGSQTPPPLGAQTPPPLGAQTPPGAASKPMADNALQEGKERERKERNTSPPPSLPRAGARGLDRLTEYLGPYAEAAERFAASADHSPTWPAAVIGLYGPSGTDPTIWQRSPPVADADRPMLLARAMDRYAAEGHQYDNRYFRRFLERVIDEHHESNDQQASDHPRRPAANGRGAAPRARPAALGAGDPARRSGWVYE